MGDEDYFPHLYEHVSLVNTPSAAEFSPHPALHLPPPIASSSADASAFQLPPPVFSSPSKLSPPIFSSSPSSIYSEVAESEHSRQPRQPTVHASIHATAPASAHSPSRRLDSPFLSPPAKEFGGFVGGGGWLAIEKALGGARGGAGVKDSLLKHNLLEHDLMKHNLFVPDDMSWIQTPLTPDAATVGSQAGSEECFMSGWGKDLVLSVVSTPLPSSNSSCSSSPQQPARPSPSTSAKSRCVNSSAPGSPLREHLRPSVDSCIMSVGAALKDSRHKVSGTSVGGPSVRASSVNLEGREAPCTPHTRPHQALCTPRRSCLSHASATTVSRNLSAAMMEQGRQVEQAHQVSAEDLAYPLRPLHHAGVETAVEESAAEGPRGDLAHAWLDLSMQGTCLESLRDDESELQDDRSELWDDRSCESWRHAGSCHSLPSGAEEVDYHVMKGVEQELLLHQEQMWLQQEQALLEEEESRRGRLLREFDDAFAFTPQHPRQHRDVRLGPHLALPDGGGARGRAQRRGDIVNDHVNLHQHTMPGYNCSGHVKDTPPTSPRQILPHTWGGSRGGSRGDSPVSIFPLALFDEHRAHLASLALSNAETQTPTHAETQTPTIPTLPPSLDANATQRFGVDGGSEGDCLQAHHQGQEEMGLSDLLLSTTRAPSLGSLAHDVGWQQDVDVGCQQDQPTRSTGLQAHEAIDYTHATGSMQGTLLPATGSMQGTHQGQPPDQDAPTVCHSSLDPMHTSEEAVSGKQSARQHLTPGRKGEEVDTFDVWEEAVLLLLVMLAAALLAALVSMPALLPWLVGWVDEGRVAPSSKVSMARPSDEEPRRSHEEPVLPRPNRQEPLWSRNHSSPVNHSLALSSPASKPQPDTTSTTNDDAAGIAGQPVPSADCAPPARALPQAVSSGSVDVKRVPVPAPPALPQGLLVWLGVIVV